MKTILQNRGNQRLFKECERVNADPRKGKQCFVVNVWVAKNHPSYDAGFHSGRQRRLGEPSPSRLSAAFNDPSYRKNVGYRIRVWPKKAMGGLNDETTGMAMLGRDRSARSYSGELRSVK